MDRRVPAQLDAAAYKGVGGTIGNINASWQTIFFDYVEDGTRTAPGQPARLRSVRAEEGGHNHEIGGDYEFGLGNGRLKLIGLNRFVHTPTDATVDVRDPAGGDRGFRSRARGGNGTNRPRRISLEGRRDCKCRASTPQQVDSVSIVGRCRRGYSHPILSHAAVQKTATRPGHLCRRPTPTSLQVSLGGEYSKLAQVGGGGLVRTFRRPKGLVSLAWKASPTLDINVKLQRRVGQLNFYDFLASVDLNDNQTNAGNPDLVPPQTSELEVEATRNLGRWGNTSLRMYTQRIDDIVDIVPIGASGESPGNIDRASVHGVEWKATFNLDALGWSGAKLTTLWQHEASKVRDPLTGEHRPISNNLKDAAQLAMRHDVAGTDWAWGADLNIPSTRDYRLSEVDDNGRPVWGGCSSNART